MTPSSLAGHAVELLDKIVKADPPADKVISDFYRSRKYLGSHDRRWITEKAYGIIRNFLLLRKIGAACSSDTKALDIFLLHEILIAGMKPEETRGTYSDLLETYRLAGHEIDLENLSICSVNKLTALKTSNNEFILNSFPDFFCDLLPSNMRNECVTIMKALNREAHVCVRVDTMKISRDTVVDSFRKIGIEASASMISPLGIYLSKRVNLNNVELFRDGMVEIQEEASQLVGLIVDPQRDEIIVDACAGAGGKSLEFASLSGGLSKIYSLDIDRERLKNLKIRSERGGHKGITPRLVSNNSLQGIEGLVTAADKVVIDAPCTGSGTIRRNPDKKFRLTKSFVEKKSIYQKKLLSHYSQLAKVGGLLYYATCSIFEEENQSVVKSFVDSNPQFQFVDVSQILVEPRYSDLIEDGFLAIYPHRAETDGFFVAVMKRGG